MIISARLAAVGLAALTAALSVVPRPAAEPVSDDYPAGAALFARHCASCHTLGDGARMGPDLAGVTLRRPSAWLLRWIDSPSTVATTDTVAAALVREWGGWLMPDIELTGSEILDIVDFLTAVDAGEVGADELAASTTMTCPMRAVAGFGGQPYGPRGQGAGEQGAGPCAAHGAGHGSGHGARPGMGPGAGHGCRH